jgi:hypothetical protein
MGLDRKTGLQLVGTSKAPPPIPIRDNATGEVLEFPQAAIGAISRDVLNVIVTEVTRNITQNVINNFCARLKDRCAFKLDNGNLCRVSRAAHGNSHDFTESQPSQNGAVHHE